MRGWLQEGDDEYSPSKKSKKANKRGSAAGKKKKGGSDNDSDEDWGKGKKKRGSAAGAKKAGVSNFEFDNMDLYFRLLTIERFQGAKRTGGGYTKPVKLSADLAALVGEDTMPRHEVVKRVWAIIKERNLYVCNLSFFVLFQGVHMSLTVTIFKICYELTLW